MKSGNGVFCLTGRTRFLTLTMLISAFAAAHATGQEATLGSRFHAPWDNYSDTWAATDALGRRVATHEEVGPPRSNRWVGIFYFLWHGAHVRGGPWDVTRILNMDPEAAQKKDSPLWGPIGAPHHWGEPLFGYYLGDDRWVLRKHAQMLADAGVDTLIFDVSNRLIYEENYTALFDTLEAVRAEGNATPYVAFLAPFGDPGSTVRELYDKLYSKGRYEDLWFRWEGKPLILANPDMVSDGEGNMERNTPNELKPGHTLGQSFTVGKSFDGVGGCFPTYAETDSAMTLTLFRDGPEGKRLISKSFEAVQDNAWVSLKSGEALPAGSYYLEASGARGKIGWWSHTGDVYAAGSAFADGVAIAGDRTIRIDTVNPGQPSMRDFFTFRTPQPSMFAGSTGGNVWGWLQAYPQNVFPDEKGQPEEMAVGVAQNAITEAEVEEYRRRAGADENAPAWTFLPPSAGHKLGVHGVRLFSDPRSRSRNYHEGQNDRSPGAVRHGYNFAEQWDRALQADPAFIFVTGWNEWFAGRLSEPIGETNVPVMFCDAYDQVGSRDVEPMKGGYSDNYYYQMVNYIRRFKGARALPVASRPRSIDITGSFSQWSAVSPEYRDNMGDTVHRDHPGFNTVTRYQNATGRNDIILSKVARDAGKLYFYVKTREAMSPYSDPDWMVLFINTDRDPATGWEGYDIAINRRLLDGATSVVEHTANGWNWQPRDTARFAVQANELMLAVGRKSLGLSENHALDIEFKWADNFRLEDDIDAFTLNGDSAPFGRFNYRYKTE